MPTQEDIYNALSMIMDPELHLPITDLGLIYDIQIEGTKADVKMTLTTPGCPLGATILDQAKNAVLTVDGINETHVEIVWEPPWSIDMMSDEARMQLGML